MTSLDLGLLGIPSFDNRCTELAVFLSLFIYVLIDSRQQGIGYIDDLWRLKWQIRLYRLLIRFVHKTFIVLNYHILNKFRLIDVPLNKWGQIDCFPLLFKIKFIIWAKIINFKIKMGKIFGWPIKYKVVIKLNYNINSTQFKLGMIEIRFSQNDKRSSLIRIYCTYY